MASSFRNDPVYLAWMNALRKLYQDAVHGYNGTGPIFYDTSRFVREFEAFFGRFVALDKGVTWSPEAEALLRSRFLTRPEDGDGIFGFGTSVAYMRAIRIGFALASGDTSTLREGDRPVLGRHLPRYLDRLPSPAPPVQVDLTSPVAVHVAWTQRLPRRKTLSYVRSATAVRVERVAGQDAPVSLEVLAGDGSGWLAFREVDGELYRSLMAPNSWRPITLAEFVEASSGTCAWNDDPLSERPPVHEAGTREATEHGPYARTERPRSMATMEFTAPAASGPEETEAVDAALGRAGRLLSIDGVVYRRSSMPALRVVSRHGNEPGVSVAWAARDFAMTDVQNTFWCEGDPRYGLSNDVKHELQVPATSTWMPLEFDASEGALARDVAVRYARFCGVYDQAREVVRLRAPRSPPDPVTSIRTRMDAVRASGFSGMKAVAAAVARTGRHEPGAVADAVEKAMAAKLKPRTWSGEPPCPSGREELYAGMAVVLMDALRGGYDVAVEPDEEAAVGMSM